MENYDTREIDSLGTIRYKLGDKLHRLDGPAVETSEGIKQWYQNGKLHRLNGPAIEDLWNSKYWYQNGKLHRLNGPAYEHFDGRKEYYLNGIQIDLDIISNIVEEIYTEVDRILDINLNKINIRNNFLEI